MRIKRDRRGRNVAWNRANHNSKLILSRINNPHRLHLLHQQLADFQLPRRAGIGRRGLAGGRVDLYVLQKAFEQACSVHEFLLVLSEMRW